jgi:hypothetical protein
MAISYRDRDTEARALQRRRLVGERLQAQSQQGAPMEWSRMPVTPSYGIGHGLVQMGNALLGGHIERSVDRREDEINQQRREAIARSLSGMAPNATPAQTQAVSALPLEQQEALIAQQSAAQMFPQAKPGFTLGEDQVRYDSQGKEIARGPASVPSASNSIPGSLQELEAINADRASRGEPPMKPEEYLAQRRGSSADSQLYAQYVQGLAEGVQPLPMDQFLTQFRAGVSGAQTRASEGAKVNVEALADLPRVQQNATQATKIIDDLLNHPGFSGIFGKSALLQPQWAWGSDWADANALLNQIKGKTFLEAFQTLKGGGQITELEGIKAEQAIARLDRAQSDEAAKLALLELKEIAKIGVDRARQRAGLSGGSAAPQAGQAAPTRYVYDPQTGQFEPM